MTRRHLLPLAALIVLSIAPRRAVADEAAPPCSAEADAVGKMKKRDPSLASPTHAEATRHIEAAKRAYGVGQYDQAIDEYVAAGLVDDATLILYNMAQTYRAAKEYEKAIRQYRLFLDRGQPGAEVHALVECHIRTMTAELEAAASTAPPSGPDAGEPAPSAVEPAVSVVAEPAPVTRSRWTTMRRGAIGAAGVGLVALTTGIVFGVQAADLNADAAALCPNEPCANADEANVLVDRADSRATLANVSYGAGVGLIVAGAVLWYVGAPQSHTSTQQAYVPLISPHASAGYAGLDFSMRF